MPGGAVEQGAALAPSVLFVHLLAVGGVLASLVVDSGIGRRERGLIVTGLTPPDSRRSMAPRAPSGRCRDPAHCWQPRVSEATVRQGATLPGAVLG